MGINAGYMGKVSRIELSSSPQTPGRNPSVARTKPPRLFLFRDDVAKLRRKHARQRHTTAECRRIVSLRHPFFLSANHIFATLHHCARAPTSVQHLRPRAQRCDSLPATHKKPENCGPTHGPGVTQKQLKAHAIEKKRKNLPRSHVRSWSFRSVGLIWPCRVAISSRRSGRTKQNQNPRNPKKQRVTEPSPDRLRRRSPVAIGAGLACFFVQ